MSPSQCALLASALRIRIVSHCPMHAHCVWIQDTTVRQLSLSLWGGSCGYTAENVTYPGAWLGTATATLVPATCAGAFSPGGVRMVFGASSATPSRVSRTPPLFLHAKLTDVLTSVTGDTPRATEGQILSYMEVGGVPREGRGGGGV